MKNSSPPRKVTQVPTEETKAIEKVRPELNLEKWTSIWVPASSVRKIRERKIQREITLSNGSKISAEVEIGFTNKGALTTEDQKTYYALIKHWENRDHPIQQTFFSLRQLARILKRRWGTNVIDSLTASLIRLRVTPLIWRDSYYDKATKQTMRVIDPFNILADLKIIQRERDGVVNKEIGYFRFNDFILRNLHANHTKPLLLETILNFRSEIAQLAYVYLDLILADKNHYERKTKDLFDDLGLEAREYRKLSVRLRMLKRVLPELQGVKLTTGVLSSAHLEKTKDKHDLKVVFVKTPTPHQLEAPATEPSKEDDNNQIPQLTHEKPNTIKQAEQLVQHFHKLFFNVERVQFQFKELDQATTLIARHGFELAKYAIEYAYRAAPESGYKIQTFGGTLQYTSRALATYEEHEARKQTQEAIARCSLCNRDGWISFEDSKRHSISMQCPHDLQKIRQIEEKKGWRFISL